MPAERLVATHRNHVWALDFLFDATSDGRPLKALSACDEHTRVSVGGHLDRSITADDVTTILDDAVAEHGAPEYLRCDNGPEFIAVAIRTWCTDSGVGTSFIEPGSSWQNPYVESFNARVRDELLSREVFDTVREGQVMYADWRHRYNHHHPHSALGWMTPAAFAAAEAAKTPVTT